MRLRQAEIILAVYENGSISAAARRLFVTQPALSQAIQSAERDLGMPIFNRKDTPISLTLAGERYVAAARRMLACEKDLEREICDLKEERSGLLRIGISVFRSMSVFPHVLAQFTARYPLVKVELVEAGSAALERQVRCGSVDFAFVLPNGPQDPQLAYTLLAQEEILLYASPQTRLARETPPGQAISIEMARAEKFIALRPGHGLRSVQDYLFSACGIAPPILLEVGNPETARRLAHLCGAVTLYSSLLLQDGSFVTAGRDGCYYPLVNRHHGHEFYLCHRKDIYLPAYMCDFIAVTRAVYG